MSDEAFNADVTVVGGGPAGAACAIVCRRAGLRTVVLERAKFPRDKVCGDCLNPDCWPLLADLGVADRMRKDAHMELQGIQFISRRGRETTFALPPGREIAIKRRLLDQTLLAAAAAAGARVFEETAVCAISPGFTLRDAQDRQWTSRFVVAADGRNSLVARSQGLLPPQAAPRRIGLQCHVPAFSWPRAHVRMQWLARGYGGIAPVGNGEINVSLAGPPAAAEAWKQWVRKDFRLREEPVWRSIAPLDRVPARVAARDGLFLVGDAARVVEPFTGEGIYYALRSGMLAGKSIARAAQSKTSPEEACAEYCRASREMYRGRLWVNRLARLTALHPILADAAIGIAAHRPQFLQMLTSKVVGA